MTDEQKQFYREMYQQCIHKDSQGKKCLMLHAKSPPKCFSCGLTDESIKVKWGGWTGITISDGVALYICPRCHTVSASPATRDNIFMLQVARDDRQQLQEEMLKKAAEQQTAIVPG